MMRWPSFRGGKLAAVGREDFMRIASQSLLALSRLGLAAAWLLILGSSPASLRGQELEGVSSNEAKAEAIRAVPYNRLRADVREDIQSVVDRPSFYRRMPTQQIECDAEMFSFLVRRPEVMVNIWEIMGITKVSTKRVSPFAFFANDGVGTTCKCDLVYGDANTHIYLGTGTYDGSMAPRKVTGRCVCILRSVVQTDASGQEVVLGTMDVFLKIDNFGADMLTRTIGPFVGKTADSNFVETAKFMSQISLICASSPVAAQGLALKLENIDDTVRREFSAIAAKISANALAAEARNAAAIDAELREGRLTFAPSSNNDVLHLSDAGLEPSSPRPNSPAYQSPEDQLPVPHSPSISKLELSSSQPVTLLAAPNAASSSEWSSRSPQGSTPPSASPQESGVPASSASQARPSAITPTKPNVYMRR